MENNEETMCEVSICTLYFQKSKNEIKSGDGFKMEWYAIFFQFLFYTFFYAIFFTRFFTRKMIFYFKTMQFCQK